MMDSYEKSKLSDAFKEETYKKGQFVIKEGEEGSVFYIIEYGEAVATKVLKEGGPATEVKHYKVGDYFGERALLQNEPRAANIVAKSEELVVVSMDRHSFKRLMGPMEDILKRNLDIYQQYEAKK